MTTRTKRYGNERGSTMALVAVCLVALVGMGALAIDLSVLYKLHNDAQRTADAAALAGASSFQDFAPTNPTSIDTAFVRSLRYVSANSIGQDSVAVGTPRYDTVRTGMMKYYATFGSGQVQIIPDSQKVRVIVWRSAINTWFAHILNIGRAATGGGLTNRDTVGISAKAAAMAVNAGGAKCVKPFAFPDYWDDKNNDTYVNKLEDLGPGQGKGGEQWQYGDDAGDNYARWSAPGDTMKWTGLGSHFRNNSVYQDDSKTGVKYWDDYGRPVVLKKSNPQQTMAPSFFLPWVLPGSQPGANDYKNNIVNCSSQQVNLNQEYTVDPTADTSSYDNKPGNMIGPTKQGMDSLINEDPQACWAAVPDKNHSGWTGGEVRKLDGSGKCTVAYPDWQSSPRVILIPLMDPSIADNGKTKLKFNNIALLFVEAQQGRHDPVVGRFLFFTKGTGPANPTSGPLIKKLRLVE